MNRHRQRDKESGLPISVLSKNMFSESGKRRGNWQLNQSSDEKLYRFVRQRSDFEELTFQECNEEKLGKTRIVMRKSQCQIAITYRG